MAYGRLEWKIGNTCDGGRDGFCDMFEVVEYDDIRFLAYEEGLCNIDRFCGWLVTSGGKDERFGLGDGVWA